MVTTVQHHELAAFSCATYLSKHDYSDLPQHWKYLENTLFLNRKLRETYEIIIVEKFKNVAIGFNHFSKKRPVILYRETYKSFKSLKVGDVLKVILGKMYVHVKKPTLILTDLYVAHVCDIELNFLFHDYDTYVSNGSLKVRDFTSEINETQIINDYEVLFAEFGAIVIPKKLSKMFSAKRLKDAFLMGSIKYCLTAIDENRFACWILHLDFTVYKQQIIYAKCVRGRFQIVPKADKKRRLALNTGTGIVRMVERGFVEVFDNPVRPFVDINFFNFNDILSLKPENKRTVIRNI
uniref:Uncharacterized protein n=1 Tax=Panagrolaimus superbus TaxID=310955 RepID=A0A914Y7D8_9BILA